MPTYHFRSERKIGIDRTGQPCNRKPSEPISRNLSPGTQSFQGDNIQGSIFNNYNLETPSNEFCVDEELKLSPPVLLFPYRTRFKEVSTKHTRNQRNSFVVKPNHASSKLNLRSIFVLSLAALLITATRRTSHTLYERLYRDRVAEKKLTSSNPISLRNVSNDSTIVRDAGGLLKTLSEPGECKHWRHVAHTPTSLMLYRNHFNSPQVIDWFVYAAIFDEKWHATKSHQPQYLDVGAKSSRHNSKTWFLDRCLGWHGLCYEPNLMYWKGLKEQRSCQLFTSCVPDKENGNFSFLEVPLNLSSKDAIQKSTRNTVGKLLSRNCSDDIRDFNCRGPQALIDEYNRRVDGELHAGHNKKLHFDLMVLDSACQEVSVLRGIDWNQTAIDVILTSRDEGVAEILETENYEHYSDILTDDIWIRSGSGLRINYTVVTWLGALDYTNYSFLELHEGDAFVYT